MAELTVLAWFLLAGAIVSALLFILLLSPAPTDEEPPTMNTRGSDGPRSGKI